MLKKILLIVLLLPAAYVQAQTPSYVRTWDAKVPITDPATMDTRTTAEVLQTTGYVDGLGRPIQTVIKNGSLYTKYGTSADMVSPVVYDALGREVQKFLPYAAAVNDGNYKSSPLTEQNSFYTAQLAGQGETYFYGNTDVENSPLNRPLKTYAPGNSWVGAARGTSVQYLNNEASDHVKIWKVNGAGDYSITGDYAAGLLTEMHTTDEAGNQVVEYKDKSGKVILKKVQADGTINNDYTGWLCTYYIYDDYGNLRLVLQPKAVAQLVTDSWPSAVDMTSYPTLLDELAFRYEYDDKNRMSIKKVPGAAEVYMIYDKWDRPVLTQDGNMRTQYKWIFTKYDYWNRPVMTGFYQDYDHAGQADMQAYVTGLMGTAGRYESANTSTIGYSTTSSFPSLSSPDMLTISFFDNYNWAANYSSGYATKDNSNDGLFYTVNNSVNYAQSLTQSSKTKNLATGSVVYVLNSLTGEKLTSSIFYDDHGRTIQSKQGNITGGIDVSTMQYNFSAQPLMTVAVHNKGGTNAQTIKTITKIEYDGLNRVSQVKRQVIQTIGSTVTQTPERIIAKTEYDKLGQMVTKTLAPEYNSNAGLEKLNYDYNIRGWLLGVNRAYLAGLGNAYFGMELAYDKTTASNSGTSYAAAQYNGNISGMGWKSKGDGVNRQYDFGYDKLNRLMKGDFKQHNDDNSWNNSIVNYNVKMGDGSDYTSAYDENGNIKRMQQWGLRINSSEQIDDLSYVYYSGGVSNKLFSVTDFINSANTTLGDFKDGASASFGSADPADYTYDVNGNMVTDANKNIKGMCGFWTCANGIIYNHLNLPQNITVMDNKTSNPKGTITYTYDAAGNKLKKTVYDAATSTNKTTLYVAGAVYEDDVLQFVGTEEGRVRYKPANGTVLASLNFDYFIKDHLGNVRMVLTEEAQTDVYPAATLETTLAGQESNFYTIDNTKIVPQSGITGMSSISYPNNNTIPNNNTSCSGSICTTDNSQYMYKLNSNDNKTGLGITLKVMAGDKIDVFGKSYYFQNNPGSSYNNNVPITDLLAAFLGSPLAAGATGSHGGVTASQINTTDGIAGINSMMSAQNSQSSSYPLRPKAFINVIFFDEQFKAVDYRVSMVGSNSVLKEDHHADLQNLTVPKNGFVYIYCSNETPVNVFFDNVQVVHTRGQILEETHYYPFGLTMSGISSKAAGNLENKKAKYNGYEINTDFDINFYESFYRTNDPQLGRFWQLDPNPNEFESLYTSMSNNPISRNDLLGDTSIFYTAEGKELLRTTENNKSLGNSISFIPDNNLKEFNNYVATIGSDGGNLSEVCSVQLLRGLGENYDIESVFSYVDANSKNYTTETFATPTDGKGPLVSEASAAVENKNGKWTVNPNKNKKALNNDPFDSEKVHNGVNDITLHTHDNEGRHYLNHRDGNNYTVLTGAAAVGSDVSSILTGSGLFELAANKKAVHFYNASGVIISINKDAFNPKYFKK